MKKIMNLHISSRKGFLYGGMFGAIVFVSLLGVQNADAAITNQMDFGSRISDVSQLQTYLTTNVSIYPSGLVTGYFGPLTQAGVERFQTAQGIVSSGSPATTGYGRVGPATMARINLLMGSGNQTSWDTVPVLSTPSVQQTNTTATFTWTTNEPTEGKVYWGMLPIQSDESTGPRQQPYISGTLALDAGGLQTNHAVTVSNLQANTTYHYVVRAVDSVGNMSMVSPSTFRTN